MSKLPLRKEPEVHFMPMPPGMWVWAGKHAARFHEEYDNFLVTDGNYVTGGGAFHIRATPSGNITVWFKG